MLYLSALPRPHMLCVKPQVLRPPLPPPPQPATASVQHTCADPRTWFTAPELWEHMADTLASPTVVPVKSTPLGRRAVSVEATPSPCPRPLP